MTNREFVVWIHGFLDLMPEQRLTRKMLYIIRNHLNLVRAVAGELGEFNQKIAAIVDQAIASDEANNTSLFNLFEAMVSERLEELQQAA